MDRLDEWKLIMASTGIGCLVLAGLQLWSGKTISSLGRVVDKQDEPGRFSRTVAITVFAGIVALALLLLVVIIPPTPVQK